MAPTIFNNNKGKFTKKENIAGMENTEGWWFSVSAADFDGDGDEDYVLETLVETINFTLPQKNHCLFMPRILTTMAVLILQGAK